MPPIRRRANSKRKAIEFTVPYHRFLGPGTDLVKNKYLPPLNKLDWAAKRHDLNYADATVLTREADEQFFRDSKDTGILGIVSSAALELKHQLGFDKYFGGVTELGHNRTIVGNNTTGDMDQSATTEPDAGSGNGWTGTRVGGVLPEATGNEVRSYVLKRTFKNLVKTTDMNSRTGHFTKYDGTIETGIHNVGHFCWAQPESGDYIVPYFLSTWVTQPKWEATIQSATSYRVKRIGCSIENITCGEWLTKNNEEVFIPNPEPYFNVYIDRGQYIGYGNLEGITKIPNKDFHEIQPMIGIDAELPKYKYNYAAPITLINKLPNTGPITQDNLSTDVQMIILHDWREMPDVKRVRQGDTFTHMWHNHSLLRKLITNVMTQGNYVVQGGIIATPGLLKSTIQQGNPSAWDSGLDISTAPKYGTLIKEAESNLARNQPRKRMRAETQDDLCMTEVADIAFDHQRGRKTNASKIVEESIDNHEQTSGCVTVCNRTLINKVLYTNEDAPEMILIHVPPILRPNATSGILYFTFELTYMLEIECFYESIMHPQKVPISDHDAAIAATSVGFNYELECIVPPNRHFHGQSAKGMVHNHGTHIWQKDNMMKGLGHGKFINK